MFQASKPAALATVATLLLGIPISAAQKPDSRPQVKVDDFAREGKPQQRAKKDPLEGQAPPALHVQDWMNAGGLVAAGEDGSKTAVTFDALKGKVIAIKFWGVW